MTKSVTLRHWLIFVIPVLFLSVAIAGLKPEARKKLTYCEYINGKTYGVMVSVDLDEIESWMALQVKHGLEQYTSVRIEAKYDDEWRAGEYSLKDFIRRLDLKSEYCCKKAKKSMDKDEVWDYCPYCGAKK